MQYLSRTGLMSVGEELTGTGEVCSAGACDWTFDHATAIQPQVTSAKTVGRPFMAVRACVAIVPDTLAGSKWPAIAIRRGNRNDLSASCLRRRRRGRSDQLLSVWQGDRQEPADQLAILYGLERHGDLVSGLERRPRPPALRHCCRVLRFDGPVPHGAGIVLRVALLKTVRLAPDPLVHASFH